MKTILLAIAAVIITAGAYAQTEPTNEKMSPPEIDNTDDGMNQNGDLNNDHNQGVQNNYDDKSHPDGVVMQNGKMMMVKKGQMTIMDHDMTMSNGTKVMSDGNYIEKNGTKNMMKEGQHIDTSGNLTTVKINSDKGMYFVPNSTLKKDDERRATYR